MCSKRVAPALPPLGLFSLTASSTFFQVHFHHQSLPSISNLLCFAPCLLAHQHLTNREKYPSGAATRCCQQPFHKQSKRVQRNNKKKKNQGLVVITHSCIVLPPQPREGKELTRTTATYAKAKATSAPTTTMKSRMFQRSRK